MYQQAYVKLVIYFVFYCQVQLTFIICIAVCYTAAGAVKRNTVSLTLIHFQLLRRFKTLHRFEVFMQHAQLICSNTVGNSLFLKCGTEYSTEKFWDILKYNQSITPLCKCNIIYAVLTHFATLPDISRILNNTGFFWFIFFVSLHLKW